MPRLGTALPQSAKRFQEADISFGLPAVLKHEPPDDQNLRNRNKRKDLLCVRAGLRNDLRDPPKF